MLTFAGEVPLIVWTVWAGVVGACTALMLQRRGHRVFWG